MKSYETEVAGAVVCNMHGRASCRECSYVAELEAEVFRLQDELAGDGVLTLPEQYEHAKAETERMYDKASELYSIALWSARRMSARIYAKRIYDDLEKVLGYEIIDRDWRGEQV